MQQQREIDAGILAGGYEVIDLGGDTLQEFKALAFAPICQRFGIDNGAGGQSLIQSFRIITVPSRQNIGGTDRRLGHS